MARRQYMTMSGFNEQDQAAAGCGEKLRFGISDPSECALELGCRPVNVEVCRKDGLCIGAAVLHIMPGHLNTNTQEIEG